MQPTLGVSDSHTVLLFPRRTMVVQIPVKDKVAGSSPAVGVIYRRGAMDQRKGLLNLWLRVRISPSVLATNLQLTCNIPRV